MATTSTSPLSIDIASGPVLDEGSAPLSAPNPVTTSGISSTSTSSGPLSLPTSAAGSSDIDSHSDTDFYLETREATDQVPFGHQEPPGRSDFSTLFADGNQGAAEFGGADDFSASASYR